MTVGKVNRQVLVTLPADAHLQHNTLECSEQRAVCDPIYVWLESCLGAARPRGLCSGLH